MNSEEQNNQDDDGFESEKDGNLEEKNLDEDIRDIQAKIKESQQLGKNQSYTELPPGQAIIGEAKKYSLFPDMATGWVPRDNKCHPIPITVDLPALDKLYDMLHRPVPPSHPEDSKKQFRMIVCYFGPRYDNTYYAWYQMPFQFPYQNIEPPTDMKFTNRPFNSQHPTLHLTQPNTLIFDSFFENGNLDCVIKTGDIEYDLYLRVDSNTRGHFQWYNFKVKNLEKGVKYKFNICNMQKEDSLYNRGMKPYVFSAKAKEKIDRDWVQDGQNIKYEKKPSKSMEVLYNVHMNSHDENNCRMPSYYKLSFQYSTIYDNDVIQMAYCVPYTFTDLRQYLQARRKKCESKKFYKETRLCLSLGGLPVPLITINQQINPIEQEVRNNEANYTMGIHPSSNGQSANHFKIKKKCVVIGCRVHPGQSNSSYMMQGFLDFICSNKSAARSLRNKIQFKIVPMLNPDGVCFGNYRTGLSGKDFNRQYLNPDARLFPEVFCFKKYVLEQKKKYGSNFLMFLDFHGHSVRKNVFMYGPQNSIMDKYYYESRIFPRLVSKRTEMFRYYSCVFKIEEEKKTTARSIFQQMHNIPLSFTVEASNGSYYNTEILKDFPFTAKMWIDMGTQIAISLYEYLNIIIAAEKARLEKYEKLHKFHSHSNTKQENNLRTSKILERKRQKKKGGEKLEDFNYGRVIGHQHSDNDGDEDLFKYMYEQIQQNGRLKEQSLNSTQIKKAFEYEEKIKQGESDNQSAENDLEPEKLSILYKAIKRKEYFGVSLRKQLKQEALSSTRSNDKEQGAFRNHFIHSRVRSSLGNNQQEYCKKLSQPRKKGQAIVNLAFPNCDPSSVQALQVMAMGLKNSTGLQNSKRNPKTFQDFVSSYQKWEKSQKSKKNQSRPLSAFYQNPIISQAAVSNQLSQSRNLSTAQANKKSIFFEIRKSDIKVQQQIIPKNVMRGNIKKYQSIQQQEMNQSRVEKRRTFSPVRHRNIY